MSAWFIKVELDQREREKGNRSDKWRGVEIHWRELRKKGIQKAGWQNKNIIILYFSPELLWEEQVEAAKTCDRRKDSGIHRTQGNQVIK